MFRFLAKSALATLVWKRYHRPILATIALFVGYFLVATIHGDYVDYAQTADDTSGLWVSYVIKWLLFLGLTAAYYFYLTRQWQDTGPRAAQTQTPPVRETGRDRAEQSAQDPFAVIRTKKKLKSHADIALEKSRRDKS